MGGTPPLIPLHEVSQRTPRSLRSALWLPGCPPEHLVPIPRPFPLQVLLRRTPGEDPGSHLNPRVGRPPATETGLNGQAFDL